MFLFWIFFYKQKWNIIYNLGQMDYTWKRRFHLLGFINAVKVRQLFISCFESVGYSHDLIGIQSCLTLRGFYKYYLSEIYSLFTGCKTLSHTIFYLDGALIVSLSVFILGEVWNWANNGGTEVKCSPVPIMPGHAKSWS